MGSVIQWPLPMSFPTRLVQLRKQHGLSRQRLAAAVGVHVNQVRRCEAVSQLPDEEKRIVKAQIDGMLIEYQTKCWVSGLSS